MRFRYKVLILNIILLSIVLNTVGYVMIHQNTQFAISSQIKSAVDENNYVQNTVEYQLLEQIPADARQYVSRYQSESTHIPVYIQKMFAQTIRQVAIDMTPNLSLNHADIFIIYADKLLYQNTTQPVSMPENLFENLTTGQKNYVITEENGAYFIYVTSYSQIGKDALKLVNKRNITEIYQNLDTQRKNFALLLLVVTIFDCLCMLVLCRFLTKPLEKLTRLTEKFAEGNYDERIRISSSDEIGELSETYNLMADAVSARVDDLNDMIARQEQFIADFTHEIKTPMTSIVGYADTIRSRDLPRETQIMAASYIFKEGKRLEDMSRKLFDFICTDRYGITFCDVSVSMLLTAVCESMTPKALDKEITIRPVSVNGTIQGDSSLLKTAFINLLDNAIKASDKQSTVEITAAPLGEHTLRIAVTDYGIGIPRAHIDKICNEFYMVDKSRSRKEGGAGLGLSLSALIFQKHNANFQIESTEGAGTTMSVTFDTFVAGKEDVSCTKQSANETL